MSEAKHKYKNEEYWRKTAIDLRIEVDRLTAALAKEHRERRLIEDILATERKTMFVKKEGRSNGQFH